MAASADGRLLAIASSAPDEMRVFDLLSGLSVLSEWKCADQLLFTIDRRVLVAVSPRLSAWALDDDGREREDPRFEGLGRPVALSDSGLLVATHENHEVMAFPLTSRGRPRRLYASTLPIRGLALSEDGAWLAVATGQSAVRLVRVETGAVHAISRKTNPHELVAFKPDSHSFATGGGSSILFFDSPDDSSGRVLACRYEPKAITFTPNGARIAVSDARGDVTVVDLQSGAELWRWSGQGRKPALAFIDGGDRLAVAARAKLVFLDAASGVPRGGDDHACDRIAGIAVSRDGERAVTACLDRSVDLWDLRSGARVRRLGEHESYALCAAFSPDGRWVVSGGSNGKLRFWRVEPATAEASLPEEIAIKWSDITSVAWSDDGATIAAIQQNGTIHILDASTRARRVLHEPRSGGYGQFKVAFAGRDALVASLSEEVVVVDIATGRIRARAPATHPDLAVSRGGARIAIGHENEVRILALPDLSVVIAFEVEMPGALALGSNGDLAVARRDNGVDFYDSGTNRGRSMSSRRDGDATALALLVDARLLIGPSHGETIVVETSRHTPVPDDVATARRDEVRTQALAELLDAFRTRAITGGYRGSEPARGGAAPLGITVPIAGGTACVRAQIAGTEIHLSIAVGPGSDAPLDLVPRDPIARARRWIKDRLSADGRREEKPRGDVEAKNRPQDHE